MSENLRHEYKRKELLFTNGQVSERTHQLIATLISFFQSRIILCRNFLTHSRNFASLPKKMNALLLIDLGDPCYMCYVTNFHVSALSWRRSETVDRSLGHRVKYGLGHWTLGPLDYFLDHFLD